MTTSLRRQLAVRRELLTMEIELQRWKLRAELAQARRALSPASLLCTAWKRISTQGTVSGLALVLWRWWRRRHRH